MRWRGAQTTILTALTFLVVGAAALVVTGATASDSGPDSAAASRANDPTVYATVDATPAAAPLPGGFLGVSLEYSALEAYTGADPAAVDPVFFQLLRNLGGGLVIRIGGNSTDQTWWPAAGVSPPAGASYALTPDWLASARALSSALGDKLILGVNLAAGQPELASAEADALLGGIGAENVDALELGNEPDVYGVFPWYRSNHRPVFARSADYDLNAFLAEVRSTVAAMPPAPMAGPASAELPWLSGVPALLAAEPGLRMVTVHRYPLQGCLRNPYSPSYPAIGNLLSDRSSAGLAEALAPYVALAHAHGLQFRVDELNSAAMARCLARPGPSNTFASGLWMLDALFSLASVGVDGVNIHSLPGVGYELFTFRRDAAGWEAFVHPDYYGMLMFAQAFPPGAQLLGVHTAPGPVKVWATRGTDGRTRVAVINKDDRPHRVELQLPLAPGRASVEWLRAPGAAATGGVTLGGRSFGAETTTGVLPGPVSVERVPTLFGWYSLQVPAYTAALLTR